MNQDQLEGMPTVDYYGVGFQQGKQDALKEVGEWLKQPCPHMTYQIRRVCRRCISDLAEALCEGGMP